MGILYEAKRWRRERSATARQPDLDAQQVANLRRAIATLRKRYGGLPALAVAAGLKLATMDFAAEGRHDGVPVTGHA